MNKEQLFNKYWKEHTYSSKLGQDKVVLDLMPNGETGFKSINDYTLEQLKGLVK